MRKENIKNKSIDFYNYIELNYDENIGDLFSYLFDDINNLNDDVKIILRFYLREFNKKNKNKGDEKWVKK